MKSSEKIVLRKVSKSYNGFEVLRNLSFRVKEGETLVLIGTSGCGKTTTLKMINRLIEPSKGIIEIDGKDISSYDVIDLRRNIGYVIQSIGLFPHMTVGENISIVPKLQKWPKEKIDLRINNLLEMINLEPEDYRDRYPAELSGGQQQRIGVARALAADPPIILMDEPFGALDPITREGLQNEFLLITRKIEKTIIFVTHDIFEAVKIGDRLALMDKGRIIQIGTPKEIIEKPRNKFVLDFLGRHHYHLSLLLIPLDEIKLPMDTEKPDFSPVEAYPSLGADAIFIDALNYFKQYETERILIREKDGKLKGFVTKDQIRKRLINSLQGVHTIGS